jgi:hypothetical protein
MRVNYVLIDFESVQVKSLALLRAEHFRIYIFLGPTNTKLPRDVVTAVQQLGDRARYVELESPGPNALDFHIAYYIGVLATQDPDGFFHVISKDTGFDPLIKHLKTLKIFSARSTAIEEMACIKTADASNGAVGIDALIDKAVIDLAKRKAALPKTVETLKRTLNAGADKVADETLDLVLQGLAQRSHLRVEGNKVVYSLPAVT